MVLSEVDIRSRPRFCVWASLGFLLTSGSVALALPLYWAALFGLPTTVPLALAFARVAGAREVVLAITAFVLLKRADLRAVRLAIGLSTLIGVADFSIVWGLRGPPAALNLAIHASGIVLLATTWSRFRRCR